MRGGSARMGMVVMRAYREPANGVYVRLRAGRTRVAIGWALRGGFGGEVEDPGGRDACCDEVAGEVDPGGAAIEDP